MAIDTIKSSAVLDGAIATADIADNAVTTAKITDANITTAKVADDAITSAKLDTNIAVGGTLGVTGATTLSSNVAVNGGTGGQVATNFSSASTMGMKINDTNSGNLGGMLGFYSGSGAGTLRANIQNANNAGVHFSVGTGGSVVFTQTGYTAANALDDYEEGTWTPSFTGASGNPTVSYTVQIGYYTKIGSIVYATCDMRWSSWTGGSGHLRINTLPFVTNGAGSGQYQNGVNINYFAGASATVRGGYFESDTTYYYARLSSNNQSLLQANQVSNSGGHFMGTVVYRTNV